MSNLSLLLFAVEVWWDGRWGKGAFISDSLSSTVSENCISLKGKDLSSLCLQHIVGKMGVRFPSPAMLQEQN